MISDVIVVGGGVLGATVAYLSAREGLRTPVPAVTGVLLATGHGPGGLTLGPYSARVVVDLLLGRAAGFDLAPFRIDRFSRAATPLPR